MDNADESDQSRETRDGFSIHRLQALFRIGNAPVLPKLPLALRDFDLIHLHYPFIGGAELVRIASTLFHTPLVVTFHNDLVGDGARKYLFQFYQSLSVHLSIQGLTRLCVLSLDHYYSSRLYRLLSKHDL